MSRRSPFALSLALSLLVNTPVRADYLTFDVSGSAGHPGSDGMSHSTSPQPRGYGHGNRYSYPIDGRDGGDASQATPGQDAGRIFMRMNEKQKGVVTLYVDSNSPRTGNQKRVEAFNFGAQGYIFLNARGGDGGRGGNGGDGEGGGPGFNGRDADRYHTGESGGPGGRGGANGIGTNGANGGDGGKIVVEVPADQTRLLMLVGYENRGGTGGSAGTNGAPGEGGYGGRGGDSHSWTEYVDDWYYETVTDYSTSPPTTKSERKHRLVPVTRTTPGGYDGPNGPAGPHNNPTLYHGQNGRDGQYKIRVVDSSGKVEEYHSVYDLRLKSYRIRSENGDNVLEPGERVFVEQIVISNTGGMLTPANTPVRIYLANSAFTLAEPIELVVPKSLQPGETFTFADAQKLSFRVKSNILYEPGQDRARWSDSISPLAELNDVNRRFSNFHNTSHLKITYPIEIEPITSVDALAPGQATKFLFKVTNVSNIDFGKDSALQRSIEVAISRDGGDMKDSDLKFKGNDGTPLDLNQGILHAIRKLGPGESALIEGVVEVAADAEAYKQGTISSKLSLARVEDGQMQVIQDRTYSIRVSQTYAKSPDADFLLIVNSEVSRDTLLSWQKLAQNLGTKMDVWDLSLNTTLKLTEALKNGSSLMNDFRGKTIILLANTFNNGREPMKATEFLRKRDFLKASAEAGVNFLVIGAESSDYGLIDTFLVPTEGKVGSKFRSISEFLKGMARAKGPQEVDQASADFTEEMSEIDVGRTYFFGKPKEGALRGQATGMQKKLESMHPERRYFVVVNYSPEQLSNGFIGMFKKWRAGRIEVRRSLDATHGSGILLESRGMDIHSPSFIASAEVHMAVLMSMSFERKLGLYNKLLGSSADLDRNRSLLGLLNQAIMADLANEQANLRRVPVSSAVVQEKLVFLKKLSESPLRLAPGSPEIAQSTVISLAGSLEFLLKEQLTFWDKVWPVRRHAQVTSVSRGLLDAFIQRVFQTNDRRAGFKKDDVQARVRAEADAMSAKLQEEGDRREQSMNEVTKATKHLRSAGDLRKDGEDRVLDSQSVKGLQQWDERRNRDADEKERRSKERRDDNVIPPPAR